MHRSETRTIKRNNKTNDQLRFRRALGRSLRPAPSLAPPPAEHNVFLKMLPITLAVFVGFLTIGLPLPVLPLHLHYTLGLSPVVVGIADRRPIRRRPAVAGMGRRAC